MDLKCCTPPETGLQSNESGWVGNQHAARYINYIYISEYWCTYIYIWSKHLLHTPIWSNYIYTFISMNICKAARHWRPMLKRGHEIYNWAVLKTMVVSLVYFKVILLLMISHGLVQPLVLGFILPFSWNSNSPSVDGGRTVTLVPWSLSPIIPVSHIATIHPLLSIRWKRLDGVEMWSKKV